MADGRHAAAFRCMGRSKGGTTLPPLYPSLHNLFPIPYTLHHVPDTLVDGWFKVYGTQCRASRVIPIAKRELFIDNLLVEIHLIIEMLLLDRPHAMGVGIFFSR